jgi:TRAP-type C4-dicarboxylate transport system substrate-binding protein
MSYKGLSTVLGLGVAAALVTGLTPITDTTAGAQTFRYSQWLPAGHFSQREVLHVYFKDVEKATQGRVKIQPTAKGLGAPPRQYQLLVDGIADVIFVPHGYTPGVHPLSEMAELPFITRSSEANSVAYWRVFKKHLEPAGMHKQVHTLNVHVHPAGHLYNNKREVKVLTDFKGIKFRSTTFGVSEALRIFGAVPVAGPVTALRNGLAKGVYDGTSFTDEAVYAFKISKFIKYVTRFPGGLYNTSFMIGMNKKSWGKISKADQATVMSISGEVYSKRVGKIWDAYEVAAEPKLKANGVAYHVLGGATLAEVKTKLSKFEANWIAKVKERGVDGAAALKMFRGIVASYGS